MPEPDLYYFESPDANNLPAVVSMRLSDKGRWYILKGIASKSEARWIIAETDEALAGPLQTTPEGVRKFCRYLIENNLLYVREDGHKIITRRAFPHLLSYPDTPNAEESIRNLHALAAAGSASYAASRGAVPSSGRKALERAWDKHVARMAAQGSPVPAEEADRRAFARAREEFAARFAPWYMAEQARVGSGGRVAVRDYVDATWSQGEQEGEIVTTKSVTISECHAADLRDNSQSHSHTEREKEREDISGEMSFEIQKETTDNQNRDCHDKGEAECHSGANMACDIFFRDNLTEAETAEPALPAAVAAAVDLLVKGGIRPRTKAVHHVNAFGVERCTLYAQAMPSFLDHAKRQGKPIRKKGAFLLLAIEDEYDLPPRVQAEVDRRQARAALGPAPAAQPEADTPRLRELDGAYGALGEAEQRAIDRTLLETLPAGQRVKLRDWIEAGRQGEPPLAVRSQLEAHRRRIVQKQQGGG